MFPTLNIIKQSFKNKTWESGRPKLDLLANNHDQIEEFLLLKLQKIFEGSQNFTQGFSSL